MITGPNTTWCQVDDMRKAIAFYRDALGLPVLFESTHWTELQLGPIKLALHLRLESGEGPCGDVGRGWLLGLACEDIEAVRKAVVHAGGGDHGYHDVPGGVVLTITDLDGNPLQAFQAGVSIADLTKG